MSEPFYYGPWDIEKIQNDIKELQESGSGSGGGLPYFFPLYLSTLKVESVEDDTYTEIPISNATLMQGYFSGATEISLNVGTYRITAIPSSGYVLLFNDGDSPTEITEPFTIELSYGSDIVLMLSEITNPSSIEDISSQYIFSNSVNPI